MRFDVPLLSALSRAPNLSTVPPPTGPPASSPKTPSSLPLATASFSPPPTPPTTRLPSSPAPVRPPPAAAATAPATSSPTSVAARRGRFRCATFPNVSLNDSALRRCARRCTLVSTRSPSGSALLCRTTLYGSAAFAAITSRKRSSCVALTTRVLPNQRRSGAMRPVAASTVFPPALSCAMNSPPVILPSLVRTGFPPRYMFRRLIVALSRLKLSDGAFARDALSDEPPTRLVPTLPPLPISKKSRKGIYLRRARAEQTTSDWSDSL